MGSSYILNELSAAFLYAQLPYWEKVKQERAGLAKKYRLQLESVLPFIDLPLLPGSTDSNHHLFFIRCKSQEERRCLQLFLKEKGIAAYFHYVPLHSSKAGKQYGCFRGIDKHTTLQSSKLLRQLLFPGMNDIGYITDSIKMYFNEG